MAGGGHFPWPVFHMLLNFRKNETQPNSEMVNMVDKTPLGKADMFQSPWIPLLNGGTLSQTTIHCLNSSCSCLAFETVTDK